ncbi:hypothetical protein Tco_1283655 [Tanacetum coccineum]
MQQTFISLGSADRSDFYHDEFADELAHIISPPEYDCFYFKSEPDPGELTSIVDIRIRVNVLSTTNVNLPFEDDQSPLLAYIVWIFLPFLTIARIFEASRARGFVLRSLELHILSFIWESNIQILSTNSRGIEILSFLKCLRIALREDTQYLSMGDFGNGYPRKGQKQSHKRQNQARERKEREEKSKSKPKVKKSTGSKSSQSQPREVALERASKTEPENLIAKSGPTRTHLVGPARLMKGLDDALRPLSKLAHRVTNGKHKEEVSEGLERGGE